LEHQRNRQMNLEVAEKLGASAFVQQNALFENMSEGIRMQTEDLEKQTLHVNAERKKSQEQAKSQIDRMTRRRDEAIGLAWQIKGQCDAMEEELRLKRPKTDA
jgi:hypothetical protein